MEGITSQLFTTTCRWSWIEQAWQTPDTHSKHDLQLSKLNYCQLTLWRLSLQQNDWQMISIGKSIIVLLLNSSEKCFWLIPIKIWTSCTSWNWMDNYILLKSTNDFTTVSHVHLSFSPQVHTKLILKSKALSHAHSPSDIFSHFPVLLISLKQRNV